MNFQIKACYDAEGLAVNMSQWFQEIVPQVTISNEVWEQMSYRVTQYLNEQLLELKITREGFHGITVDSVPESVTCPDQERKPMDPIAQDYDGDIPTIPIKWSQPEETPDDSEDAEQNDPPLDEDIRLYQESKKPVLSPAEQRDAEVAELLTDDLLADAPEGTTVVLLKANNERKYFSGLRPAIAAWESGLDVIVLMNDITLHAMLKLSKAVRINLNHHTITSQATDYAIWAKEPAVITNGTINCVHDQANAGIFVSSTLVVANLTICANTGIILNKGHDGPAMLETHGLLVNGKNAVSMIQDGNILNDYGYGMDAEVLLVNSNTDIHPEFDHKVFIHRAPEVKVPKKYAHERFSDGIRVTFL